MAIEFNNERSWLNRMVEQEDYGCVSAGGLYCRLLDEQQKAKGQAATSPDVFGRLIELARRRKGMSVPKLSTVAHVKLQELLAIERGRAKEIEPRVVFMLAEALGLPAEGLMELAGLMEPRGESLGEASVRFAAKSRDTQKLTPSEREALEEFVRVLAECTDGGRPSEE